MVKVSCEFEGKKISGKSPFCRVWCPYLFSKWRDITIFNLSRDLTKSRYYGIVWRYTWKLLIICYHHDNFRGHKHGGNGNVFNLSRNLATPHDLSHVTLRLKVLQVMSKPTTFDDHKHHGSGNIFLICQVILRDHVIERSLNLMGGTPHDKSPPCQVWWPWALW